MQATKPAIARFTLFALLLLAPVAGLLAETTIEIEPFIASWHDEIVVTVRGQACLANELELVNIEDRVITLRVVTECVVTPPVPLAYELSITLPRLDPDRYEIEVLTPEPPGVASAQLLVHARGDLVIEARPSETLPVTGFFDFTLRGYACGDTWELDGSGTDFVLAIQGLCDFGGVPQQPTYFETEIERVQFAPGTYDISVTAQYSPRLSLADSVVLEVPETPFPPLGCGSDTELCLGRTGGPHLATFTSGNMIGNAVPFRRADTGQIDRTTGFFTLFSPTNLEVTVKLLDGCAINGHRWIFASWTTTLPGVLTVTDVITQTSRTWVKEEGSVPPVADVRAFPCEDTAN
ncbi:MAG: hypothetical protein DWQ36_08985 [Acidobacteria bacterium]|nr:MAG: hypothetical protein DWQ30_22230 [Acidobacteriota bacterium]REK08496.1 MAG: hypothetical protein DWQ36_08985 [Acidobacteriota bacterium]